MERETVIAIPTYFANNMVKNCVGTILDKVASPKLTVYKNDIGWLKAANTLMREALVSGQNIVLLNDDTLIITDIIKAFHDLADTDPKIGIIGGVALSINMAVVNYGIYVGADGNTAHKYFGKQIDDIPEYLEQKAVEGSCMFIRNEVLQQIGVFDEDYGKGYREEVDLAFRAREQGWKVVSTSNARYIHFVNQTHGKVGIENSTHKIFMDKWGTKLKLGEI